MFFILSKTIYWLAMPAAWLSIFLLLAIYFKAKKRKVCLIIAFVIFYVFSNNFIINHFYKLWEFPPIEMKQVQNFEIAVVLTGFSKIGAEPNDRTYFLRGADRLIHTVQLYKMQKIKKILISGAPHFNRSGEVMSRKNDILATLIYLGVAEEDIILEEKSRNTYENALFTAQKLKELGYAPSENILLITSSFHLRRSMGCFKAAKVNFTPFPTDFYAENTSADFMDFLPNEHTFWKSGVLVHEIVGYCVYRLLGYAE